jgi:hypothetical protein
VKKTIEYDQAKALYDQTHPEGSIDPSLSNATNGGDILVGSGITTTSKEGKEYSGKKRGRKSNAEKAALAASGATVEGEPSTDGHEDLSLQMTTQAIQNLQAAQAVAAESTTDSAEKLSKKEKKEKKRALEVRLWIP